MKKQGIFLAFLPMLISLLALSAFAQDDAYIYSDGISSNTIDGGVNSQINTDTPDRYEDFSIGTIINNEYGVTVSAPSQSTVTNDYEPPYVNLTPNVIFGNDNKSGLTNGVIINMSSRLPYTTYTLQDVSSSHTMKQSYTAIADVQSARVYYIPSQPKLEFTPFFYDDKCLKLKDLMKYVLFAMELYIENGELKLRWRDENNSFNTNNLEIEQE